jgi:hypothetical protein
MATPVSGPISLNNLAQEFGGTTPHAMSEYYNVAAGVPASGLLRLSDFYNKVATAAVFNYTTRYQRQSEAFYSGRRYIGPLMSFLGSYQNAGQSFTSNNLNYFIGHPIGKVIVDYSWEQFDYGPSSSYGSSFRGFGHFLITVAANNPEIFDILPYVYQGNGVSPDTRISFKLKTGFTISYYQQDQSGTGNDLGRTGQSYNLWMGASVTGVEGVPGIGGSGNGGSRFQISRIS